MRIGVVGSGAVGSLFAAHLGRLDDVETWVYDLNQEHVDAINENGLRLSGVDDVIGHVKATSDASELPQLDFAIVATKSMHTNSAITTIDRICDVFPAGQQNQIRTTLADVLRGVVAQTLCRRVGGGRLAAVEVLVGNAAVTNLIREGKVNQLPNAMQVGRNEGMRVMNEELVRLVKRRVVTKEEALLHTTDKNDLRKRLATPPPPAGKQPR